MALLVGAFFLAGCGVSGTLRAITGGDVTDAFIARAAQFNDSALDGIDAAEAFLEQKTARLRLAKCRFPYTALVRYGCSSEAHRAAVERDCGLVVRCGAGVALVPPVKPPGEPGQ